MRLNTQPTLCDELVEGLTYDEIFEKLTDEQLVECGYVSPDACWLSPQNSVEDYEGEE